MLHFEGIVNLSSIISEHTCIRCLCKLERSECIHGHKGSEVGSAVGPAEDVLVVEEVCSKEDC